MFSCKSSLPLIKSPSTYSTNMFYTPTYNCCTCLPGYIKPQVLLKHMTCRGTQKGLSELSKKKSSVLHIIEA